MVSDQKKKPVVRTTGTAKKNLSKKNSVPRSMSLGPTVLKKTKQVGIAMDKVKGPSQLDSGLLKHSLNTTIKSLYKKRIRESRTSPLLQSIPRAKHDLFQNRSLEDHVLYSHDHPTRSLKRFWNTDNQYFALNINKSSIGLNPSRFSFPLRHAVSFLKTAFVSPRPYTVVFVGSDGWTGELAAAAAYKSKQAFVSIKWVPGLLTNWATIRNSIQNFKTISGHIKDGVEKAWEKFRMSSGDQKSGKSSVDLNFSIHKMNHLYERYSKFLIGLKMLSARPSLLIVLDTDSNMSAIREAQRCGIPVIAVVGGSTPLSNIDYPIPCLPGSKTHVHAIANILADVIISSALNTKDPSVSIKK